MKKLSIACMAIIFLVFVTGTVYSQDSDIDIEYECCCREITCCFNFNAVFPFFTVLKHMPECPEMIAQCWDVGDNPLLAALCESPNSVKGLCQKYKPTGNIVTSGDGVTFFGFWVVTDSQGLCELEVKCPVDELGTHETDLDILRSFRDEILSRNDKGRKLIDAYYKHGSDLIKAFNENPVLIVFAQGLIEKTVERLLYTTLDSELELITEEIADDIEVLAEELEVVVKNSELKQTLKQIKQDVKNRTLLR